MFFIIFETGDVSKYDWQILVKLYLNTIKKKKINEQEQQLIAYFYQGQMMWLLSVCCSNDFPPRNLHDYDIYV